MVPSCRSAAGHAQERVREAETCPRVPDHDLYLSRMPRCSAAGASEAHGSWE